MIPGRITGSTRELGKSQGYIGLPIRDEVAKYSLLSGEINAMQMVSSWSPTPDEIERINAGASIYLIVVGQVHPPVKLEVGESPDGQENVRVKPGAD